MITLDEFPNLLFFALKQQPHTDSGKVPIGDLFISQDPLQEPFKVSLRGLQTLPTASEVSDVWCSFPKKKNTLQDITYTQSSLFKIRKYATAFIFTCWCLSLQTTLLGPNSAASSRNRSGHLA